MVVVVVVVVVVMVVVVVVMVVVVVVVGQVEVVVVVVGPCQQGWDLSMTMCSQKGSHIGEQHRVHKGAFTQREHLSYDGFVPHSPPPLAEISRT